MTWVGQSLKCVRVCERCEESWRLAGAWLQGRTSFESGASHLSYHSLFTSSYSLLVKMPINGAGILGRLITFILTYCSIISE